jgi:hypothetical protein
VSSEKDSSMEVAAGTLEFIQEIVTRLETLEALKPSVLKRGQS